MVTRWLLLSLVVLFGVSSVAAQTRINLCQLDYVDLHADMLINVGDKIGYRVSTENCSKTLNSYNLQKTDGYQIEAYLGELTGGIQINITQSPDSVNNYKDSKVVSVRITKTDQAAISYHHLFTTRTDFTLYKNSDWSGNAQTNTLVKGAEMTYIFYQAAPNNNGLYGIKLAYSGDCQNTAIWRGLIPNDANKLYGDQTTMCGRQFSRNIQPESIYGKFMIVRGRKPSTCQITQNSALLDPQPIEVWGSSEGILTSPAYKGANALGGKYALTFKLVKKGTVNRIYADFLIDLDGDSTLAVTDYDGTTPKGSAIFDRKNNRVCGFSSNYTSIEMTYTWTCNQVPCEDGLILRYSYKPKDDSAAGSLSFLLSTVMVVFFTRVLY